MQVNNLNVNIKKVNTFRSSQECKSDSHSPHITDHFRKRRQSTLRTHRFTSTKHSFT